VMHVWWVRQFDGNRMGPMTRPLMHGMLMQPDFSCIPI